MTITEMPPAATDDADADTLLTRASAGDRDAFGAFYDLTAPRIHAVLLVLTRNATRSALLLEEVYVEAWEHVVARGVPRCPAWEWVSLIARRRAVAAI
ncbi:hypothetical protein NS183_00600 [Microbacterium testaceum]|uniref:hypothetical protein n=1 Tax=Microbacterium testaceum TaxID=2033 RepID=UPI0007342DCB|nr:hypothetical protein [Microbacterium testaceum]KTS92215.1 hypothetical protein NS183_00600 [Microbacterium testaceum]